MLKEGLVSLSLLSASLGKNNLLFLYRKNKRKQKLLLGLIFFQSSYAKSHFPKQQNIFQVFKERIRDLRVGVAEIHQGLRNVLLIPMQSFPHVLDTLAMIPNPFSVVFGHCSQPGTPRH